MTYAATMNQKEKIIGKVIAVFLATEFTASSRHTDRIKSTLVRSSPDKSSRNVGSAKSPAKTGLPLTDPLVGARHRFCRWLSEPGFETRLAESCVIAGNECPLAQLHAVVTRLRVSDNLARIIPCG
jgi:hypothetical protein